MSTNELQPDSSCKKEIDYTQNQVDLKKQDIMQKKEKL